MPVRNSIRAFAILLSLAACAAPQPAVLPGPAIPTPEFVFATFAPTETYTPAPTSTPAPNPLSIDYLRMRDYPASEIVIEERLEDGFNYQRFIVSYQSDGNKIFALLTVPYGDPPPGGWPAVVFNHGYIPPSQYRTTERYVAYVDAFAKRGYVVFKSDYRGHGDSEGEAGSSYRSPNYVIDILNAVAAIKNYNVVNPQRIGMWGHSMGGFITLRVMVTDADIKAGVIWGGVVASYEDMLEIWGEERGDGPRDWRGRLVDALGFRGATEEERERFSANYFLADLSGPVQLHHGTADTEVPWEFSSILNDQIRAAGGVVEYYEYRGDNHNLSIAFSLAMQRSINFFDRYLALPQ
jgi:dipeptidyl aminopeptidase/acylaminoacyl peptidase